MSIAQLPRPAGRDRRVGARRSERDRLVALVTQIEDDRLDVAADLLAEIVAQQRRGTRSLTTSDLSALRRLGVHEADLSESTALPATVRSRLWERQFAEDSITVSEASERLGVTPARVRQRCAEGTLLAQRRSDGWHLPLFQFPEGREVRGWASVARSIPQGTPLLLVERVLTSPSPRLATDEEELAPLEWLAQGGDPSLAAAAVDDALNRLP
ncbi:hypothetical protein JD276_03020 [Leucobacter sp. CSA1]|uniref:DNA-binding protein n=1 Tax=Leucobacter chromiisoli TaxID=2796471 RepID=A0A934Q6K4_9MICO|nr:hypothetical protein [Leucobacter chromiisoli]MBK0418006.1 hypothetical protein [Leucobacter chromiisoli]